MGISVDFLPMLGLGFAIHIAAPLLELVIGPLVIRLGDLDAIEDDGD